MAPLLSLSLASAAAAAAATDAPTATGGLESDAAAAAAGRNAPPVGNLSAEPARKPNAPPVRNLSAEPTRKLSAEPVRNLSAESAKKRNASPVRNLSAVPTRKPSAEPTRKRNASPMRNVSTEPAKKRSAPPVRNLTAEPAGRNHGRRAPRRVALARRRVSRPRLAVRPATTKEWAVAVAPLCLCGRSLPPRRQGRHYRWCPVSGQLPSAVLAAVVLRLPPAARAAFAASLGVSRGSALVGVEENPGPTHRGQRSSAQHQEEPPSPCPRCGGNHWLRLCRLPPLSPRVPAHAAAPGPVPPPPPSMPRPRSYAAAAASARAVPLRPSGPPVPWRQCRFFAAGDCPFGLRCRFAHGSRAPAPDVPPSAAEVSAAGLRLLAEKFSRAASLVEEEHAALLRLLPFRPLVPPVCAAFCPVCAWSGGPAAAPSHWEEEHVVPPQRAVVAAFRRGLADVARQELSAWAALLASATQEASVLHAREMRACEEAERTEYEEPEMTACEEAERCAGDHIARRPGRPSHRSSFAARRVASTRPRRLAAAVVRSVRSRLRPTGPRGEAERTANEESDLPAREEAARIGESDVQPPGPGLGGASSPQSGGRGSLLTCGDVEENPGPRPPRRRSRTSPPGPGRRPQRAQRYSWLFVPLVSFSLPGAPPHPDIARVEDVPWAWRLFFSAAGSLRAALPSPPPALHWQAGPYLPAHEQEMLQGLVPLDDGPFGRLLASAAPFGSLAAWLASAPPWCGLPEPPTVVGDNDSNDNNTNNNNNNEDVALFGSSPSSFLARAAAADPQDAPTVPADLVCLPAAAAAFVAGLASVVLSPGSPQGSAPVCCVCVSPGSPEFVVLPCGHRLHRSCAVSSLSLCGARCPLCRAVISMPSRQTPPTEDAPSPSHRDGDPQCTCTWCTTYAPWPLEEGSPSPELQAREAVERTTREESDPRACEQHEVERIARQDAELRAREEAERTARLDDLPLSERIDLGAPREPPHHRASDSSPRPTCTCARASARNRQGRHLIGCAITTWSRARRSQILAHGEGQPPPQPSLPPPSQRNAAAAPQVAVPAVPPAPRPEEIVRRPALILERVPRRCRAAVDAALSWTLLRLRTGGIDAWSRLLAFAPVVLAKRPGARTPEAEIAARARRWTETDWAWSELWRDAFVPAVRRPLQSGDEFVPLDDDATLPPMEWDTVPIEIDALPAAAVSRAEQELRKGRFARAMSSLMAARMVNPQDLDTLQQMRDLHPRATAPALPDSPQLDSAESPKPTRRQVRRALFSFALGSSGGPGRLTPQHMRDAAAAPSSAMYAALADAAQLVIAGLVPIEVRPCFFGASLCGLLKKSGGIRPVAAGNTLRRLAAKILLASAADSTIAFLLSAGQLGVGTSSGLDTAVLAARRYLASLPTAAADNLPPRGVFKLDVKNAFNSLGRGPLLASAARHAPWCLRHLLAEYSQPSILFFGEHLIPSEVGAQQGDVFGPLSFALPLAEASLSARDPHDPLDFECWILDDGTAGAELTTLARWLERLVPALRAIGLEVNWPKCQLATEDPPAAARLFQLLPPSAIVPPSAFDVLGAPCGTDPDATSAFVEAAMTRAAAKVAAVQHLQHPQMVLALLRFCAGAPLATFLARQCGPQPAFGTFDNAVRAAFDAAVVPAPPDSNIELELPCRLGGLGLRRSSDIACFARIASHAAAAPRLAAVVRATVLDTLPPDPTLALALVDADSRFPASRPLVDTVLLSAPRKAQNMLVAAAEVERASTFLASRAAPRDLARAQSNRAPFSGMWLLPLPGSEVNPRDWMPPLAFRACVRLRLGLPLAAPDAGNVCGNCGAPFDALGDHALACRARAHARHNALRDALADIAADALLAPRREQHVFAAAPGRRIDVSLRLEACAELSVLDVAVVSPFSGSHVLAAGRAPGGAATAHEATKVATYGALAAAEGLTLVPFVADALGAFSSSALAFGRTLARKWGAQFDIARSRAVPLVFRALSAAVMGRVGASLCANSSSAAPDSAPLLAAIAASAVPAPPPTSRALPPADAGERGVAEE